MTKYKIDSFRSRRWQQGSGVYVRNNSCGYGRFITDQDAQVRNAIPREWSDTYRGIKKLRVKKYLFPCPPVYDSWEDQWLSRSPPCGDNGFRGQNRYARRVYTCFSGHRHT